MNLQEFLVVALFCALFQLSLGQANVQHQTAEVYPGYEEAANALIYSLLGFEPCLDEHCQSITDQITRSTTTVREYTSTPETPKESLPSNKVEDQIGTIAPTESHGPDFCKELEWAIKEIENKDSRFKKAKFELLQKFKVHASAFLAEFKQTKLTESGILKLLQLLEFVIEKIKAEYVLKVPTEITVEEVQPEEIIAEEHEVDHPIVGSVRGIPGVHYPNYTDVPITSFTCADKEYIPGFYADLETGCQVFHVCYEHRRESFLCPVGTIFNQPILACDYWYSSNCSLSPHYYDVNKKTEDKPKDEIEPIIDIFEQSKFEVKDFEELVKFLPVKAKVIEIPTPKKEMVISPQVGTDEVASEIFDQIVSTAAKVVSKAREIVHAIPEPVDEPMPAEPKLMKAAAVIPIKKAVVKSVVKAAIPVAKAKIAAAAVPIVKAKVAAAAVPIVKAKAAAVASKVAVPVIAKAKLAAAAVPVVKAAKAIPVAKLVASSAAVPVVKAKLAAPAVKKAKLSMAAAPIVKAKLMKSAAVPLKGKITALPLAKAKFAAASVPVVKGKVVSKSLPILKAADAKSMLVGIPVKAKLAKAAMISPLTKKALALGYMKLLKAKKLHLMG